MCMPKNRSGTVHNERVARAKEVRISSIGFSVNMTYFDGACSLNHYEYRAEICTECRARTDNVYAKKQVW